MSAVVERPVARSTSTPWSVRVAVGWITLVIGAALLADFLPLAPYDRLVTDLPSRTAPGFRLHEVLGTDVVGRSVTSRLVYGARESLLVGLLSVLVALAVGLPLGTIAGYLRGPFDRIVGVLLDAVLALPALVLLLAVASVGKHDIPTLVVGLAVIAMPTFARLARANTLTLAARTSVQAARGLGATHRRVVVRELLPDVLLRTSPYAFVVLATVIVAEGALSFLGVGIPPPAPSWGAMINDARLHLETNAYLVFVPGAVLLFTVVSFTIVGDHLRQRFDGRGSK